jgi:hypothetical protein
MANKAKQSDSSLQKIAVGVVLALLVGGSAPWWWEKVFPPEHAVMSELLWNTNYQGHDIANIDRPEVNTAGECADLCLKNGQCKAMTFVEHPDKPGGICWLKAVRPESSETAHMASAYKSYE